MTDLIKRDDALAAIDMALNNATGDLFDCHAAIRALPAVASATLTPNPVDDSKTANPVVNDPAAIREAALREAYDVVYKWWFGDGNALPQELILALIGEKK